MSKKSRRASGGTGTFANLQRPTVEFNPDYSHVKSDLKRIGTLALSFFALLIVLSFFLR